MLSSQPRRETAVAPNEAIAACDSGDARKCGLVADLFFEGGPTTSKDAGKAREYQDRALELLKASCERGQGPDYRRSELKPDYAGAATFAAKGCNDARDPSCCLVLSGLYERGEGVPQDHAHAERCKGAAHFPDGPADGCP
jgi:TPR repeat protein